MISELFTLTDSDRNHAFYVRRDIDRRYTLAQVDFSASFPDSWADANAFEVIEYAIAEGEYKTGDSLEFVIFYDDDYGFTFEWADNYRQESDSDCPEYYCYQISKKDA